MKVDKPKTVKLKITITAELARKLRIQALGFDQTVSELVGDALEDLPTTWELRNRFSEEPLAREPLGPSRPRIVG